MPVAARSPDPTRRCQASTASAAAASARSLLSPFLKPGTLNDTGYNHYALLRTIEDTFGLAPLGYAAAGAWLRVRRVGSRPVTPPASPAGSCSPAPAGTAGAIAVGSQLEAASATTRLPAPDASGIDHIVVVMMENRSFDHYLGWLPGADGRQAGLCTYPDRDGVAHPTHHLTDYQGCGYDDPDHSYEGGRIAVQRRRAATAGCARATTTSSPSATTGRRTSPFYGKRRAVLDRVRPLLLRDHGRDLPEPVLPAQRAQTDRLRQLDRRRDAADDLGPAGRAGRSRRATTTATCRSSRCGARSTSTSPARSPTFLARRRGRHAAGGLLRRPALPRRGHGHARTTTTRTPTSASASIPRPGLRRPSPTARTGRARCWSSPTTSGAASSTTSRRRSAPGRDTRGRRPGCAASACRRS